MILTTETGLRTSVRNQFEGKVVSCREGAVNGEVVVDLTFGKSIVAIVTNTSIQSLGLAVDVPVSVLIKASHIIIAVKS